MEEEKEKSFVVKDRRKFTEDGESREGVEEKVPEAPADVEKEEAKEENREGEKPSEEMRLPEMNFANFIFSLSTSAMFHFGDFPDPATKKAEKNMAAAKQVIDILGMLKEKTEGNLSPDEKSILDAILFELRLRYVKEKG